MGHCHLDGAVLVPDPEDWGGLLFVLACGSFSAVVVVSDGRLIAASLLVAGGGLLGIAVPPVLGFAAAPVFALTVEEAWFGGGIRRSSWSGWIMYGARM